MAWWNDHERWRCVVGLAVLATGAGRIRRGTRPARRDLNGAVAALFVAQSNLVYR